jgi:alkylation response protein AidB-like acyl-CoA dehydrogenase
VTTTGYRSAWADDDVVALKDMATKFFETEALPHRERWAAQKCVDRDFWYKAGKLGLLCTSMPEEYRGGGGTVAHDLVEYTKDRTAFGSPLFDMQNTRFELAECATIARIARVFVDDCVERHLRGELDATTASMAKAWVSDMQVSVIDRCVQLFGGYGYMLEYPIARMFVDSSAQKIYAGANEVMKELIARSL